MNKHVNPISGSAPACLVAGDTFSNMAAKYQAACNVVNDESSSDEVAEQSFDKACEIESRMTLPEVPMSDSDIVLLAQIILDEPDLDGAFADKSVQSQVMKLLNSIVANAAA